MLDSERARSALSIGGSAAVILVCTISSSVFLSMLRLSSSLIMELASAIGVVKSAAVRYAASLSVISLRSLSALCVLLSVCVSM